MQLFPLPPLDHSFILPPVVQMPGQNPPPPLLEANTTPLSGGPSSILKQARTGLGHVTVCALISSPRTLRTTEGVVPNGTGSLWNLTVRVKVLEAVRPSSLRSRKIQEGDCDSMAMNAEFPAIRDIECLHCLALDARPLRQTS
ncbi:hypothetical protein C8Q80DRAFT_897302 [Daedaleopsis nitida]|nr:hypothetical protein C8Q80DRAFT_897302 [Daedaleopsis nitida]